MEREKGSCGKYDQAVVRAFESYQRPGDWIFASPHKAGIQPYWPGSLFRAHIKPALLKAGISAKVGWHTLRHSFGTLMKANGEDLKTIQELLPRNLQSHSRHLHTSGYAGEAGRSSKSREADHGGQSRIETHRANHPIAYWTQTDPDSKSPFLVNLLECWRPYSPRC